MSAFLNLGLLAVIIGICFAPAVGASFIHWDDLNHIVHNPYVYAPLNAHTLYEIFTQTINQTYIPLTTISFNIEDKLFGLNPTMVHVDNILVHIFNTWMVYLLAGRFKYSTLAAFLASAFFGLHPIHVESVAWATERKDVLSTLFYLLSIWFYLNYLATSKGKSFWTSVGLGFLAILAKPMAVSLPWVLFLIDWTQNRKWTIQRLMDKLPFALSIFPIAAITVIKLEPSHSLVWPDALLIGVWSSVFYIQQWVWPTTLMPLYLPQEPVHWGNPAYTLSAFTLVIILASLVIWRRCRAWVFAWGFYALTIFFLWRFNFADINIVADRFLYLPSLGFCLLAAWAWDKCLQLKKKWIGIIVAGLILCVLGLKTFQQCRIWNNDQSLWTWTLSHEPKNSLARKKLHVLLYEGFAPTIDYKHFDKDIAKNPRDPSLYNARGVKLIAEGRFDLAIKDFQMAIRLDNNFADAYLNRGNVFLAQNKYAQALHDFERAIKLVPHQASGKINKAIALSALGQESKAFELLSAVITEDAAQPQAYYQRGLISQKNQNYNDAINNFSKAITLDQHFKDSYFRRGSCYNEIKRFDLAQQDLEEILKLSPHDAQAFNELGLSLLYQNKLTQALNIFNTAINEDPYNDQLFNNRALVYLKQQRFQEALLDLNRALETSHEPYKILIAKGDVLFALGDRAGAIENYSQAIFWNTAETIALVKRARMYFDEGEFPKALNDINTAFKRTPDDESLFLVRSKIQRAMGNSEQADKDLSLFNQHN